jgi:hypothetical protein
MTTPQQPPPQQDPAQDTALAIAVGTVLVTATSAALAIGPLTALISYAKIPRAAMGAALEIVMGNPPGTTGSYGPATMAMERQNLQRRAAFVVAAARRIGSDIVAAHSQGRSAANALAVSISRERRFYAQHLLASWQRSRAGAQVDGEAMSRGLLLGWHTVRDTRTSAECRQADGRNFYADHMPAIGYPGSVHPHCRCRAGAPFPGARLLPSYGIPTTGRYRKAA